MTGAILERIAELTDVLRPPRPWQFLPSVQDLRARSIDGAQLREALEAEFSEEQLTAARVLVPGQNGDLVLSPVLAGDRWCGLFLRPGRNETPLDMVNQNGTLVSDDPPALVAGRDYFTRQTSGETNVVLTAFSDDDLAVLRMLGLPSAPAGGLAEIGGQQVRRLCGNLANGCVNARSTGAADTPARDHHKLILVGWRVAELAEKEPEGLDAVVSRLAKAEDAFGLDTASRVVIWRPATAVLQRICAGAEFADRRLIRRLIWQDATRSIDTVRQYVKEERARRASDYGAARQELLGCLHRGKQLGLRSSEVAERLETLQRSFDTSVVDALVADAMSTPDSVDRSLLLAAADLMRHWHNSSALVRSTCEHVDGRASPNQEDLESDGLEQQLRAVEGLVKIHRELVGGR